MSSSSSNEIYYDPDVAQFYDVSNKARPDFEFCQRLVTGNMSILDLGCGTGDLALSLATENSVVAVEPAAPMIDIAKSKIGADHVDWHQADAKSIRLNQKFDLVVLTGHTFQVFLNEADQSALLNTIAVHLKPAGRFIFDTRNPAFGGAKERTRGQVKRSFEHARLGLVECWNSSSYDEQTQILSYENGYEVKATGASYSAKAKIKYTSQEEVSRLMADAGLEVTSWLGDWTGQPFLESSPEIIPVGGLVR